MSANSKNKNKLIVGESYTFLIKNLVEIDDIKQFILDYNGLKFMINADNYKNYPFKLGDKINCKVDKINCAGKMFIEPEHPHFKDNGSYLFKILRNIEIKNMLDQTVHGIEVLDEFGIVHWIPNNTIDSKYFNKEIKLQIEKIKKGRLLFKKCNEFIYMPNLKVGERYEFEIVSKNEINRKKLLIVKDIYNEFHAIDLKLYQKYKLESKKQISARVIKFASDNRFMLEPDHPLYKINKAYQFKYQIIEDDGKNIQLELTDCFNQKVEAQVSKKYFDSNTNNDSIVMTISDIRKSIPLF
jgi:hypothetical protein